MRRLDRLACAAVSVAALLVAASASAQAVGDSGPGASHGGASQMFEPPPDTVDEDVRLRPGTIHIEILDADNAPVPQTSVTLGILHNSVAKGESREHKLGTTDAAGALTFDGLEHVSGIAYRVSVTTPDGGTFWAAPFGLAPDKGERVRLHIYPVTHDLQRALVVEKVAVFVEMKDDRVQIEEAVTFFNLGRVAWVPDGLIIGLPETFTALTGQQAMGGEGVDPVEKRGAKVRGTFGPGQHPIEFRWQLPYDEGSEISFEETLPPNVAMMQVMAAASQQMKLEVEGFPEAQARTDAQGERILLTERQMRRDEAPLSRVRVMLKDIPTTGRGAKYVATFLAGLGVIAGLGFAFSPRKADKAPSAKGERARLLASLEDLERAKASGDVGPKTYERARRQIVDAIARTLATP